MLNTIYCNQNVIRNYCYFVYNYCTMALIKQMNDFFLFDSHIQDFSGMPDPNGTAVVMNSVQFYYFFI